MRLIDELNTYLLVDFTSVSSPCPRVRSFAMSIRFDVSSPPLAVHCLMGFETGTLEIVFGTVDPSFPWSASGVVSRDVDAFDFPWPPIFVHALQVTIPAQPVPSNHLVHTG